MVKEMQKSREFERVGEEGSGLYRWTLNKGDTTEETPDYGLILQRRVCGGGSILPLRQA